MAPREDPSAESPLAAGAPYPHSSPKYQSKQIHFKLCRLTLPPSPSPPPTTCHPASLSFPPPSSLLPPDSLGLLCPPTTRHWCQDPSPPSSPSSHQLLPLVTTGLIREDRGGFIGTLGLLGEGSPAQRPGCAKGRRLGHRGPPGRVKCGQPEQENVGAGVWEGLSLRHCAADRSEQVAGGSIGGRRVLQAPALDPAQAEPMGMPQAWAEVHSWVEEFALYLVHPAASFIFPARGDGSLQGIFHHLLPCAGLLPPHSPALPTW